MFADLLTALTGALDALTGRQSEVRKRARDVRFARWTEAAWDDLLDGKLSEFEIGDVRLVGPHPPTPPEG